MPKFKRSLTRKFFMMSFSCLILLGPSLSAAGTPYVVHAEVSNQQAAIPAEPIQKMTIGKARYSPGEKAEFTLSFNETANFGGKLVLEFYLVNQLAGKVTRDITVLQGAGSDLTVSWQPPQTDFRGYVVKAYMDGRSNDFKTAAVDVSSDWTHFPRYGYTSDFPSETAEESEAKIKQLSQDYYLNGYQFYDWMWRHDVSVYSQTDANGKPLKDADGNFISAPYDASTSYADLLGRHLYPIAVKQQVEAAQKYGSAAMAYQMNYAARENYEDFGVKREWGLFNKNAVFPNPDPLKYQNGFYFDWVPSSLYLQDPGNPEWQSYITEEYNRSVNEFGFDGIHLDQWGAADNDFLYDYEGNERFYSRSYDELVNAVKDSLTVNNAKKNHVAFNMVGGNAGYSEVPDPDTKTDFDYSELWTDKDNYRDIKKVIEDTRAANGGKAMVIAGYMNYKQAVGDTVAAADIPNVAKTVEFLSRLNKSAGWVGDFGKKDEDQIIWTINAETAGSYDLTLKYGHDNGSGSPIGRLTVNGQTVETPVNFDEKTGWGNPIAEKTVQADLQAGENKIMLQLNTNDLWLNVDSLTVAGQGIEKEYEAEYAELISSKVDKYGHVYFFETEGDYVTFHVEAKESGIYPIQFGYSAGTANITRDLVVNGALIREDAAFAKTGNWDSFKSSGAFEVPLQAGDNTVTLKLNGETDTGMKLDYLQAGGERYEAEKAEFGWKPAKAAQIERHEGKAAGAYVTHLNNAQDSVEFEVDAAEAGIQTIVFQYASDNSPEAELYVNDVLQPALTFPDTNGWGIDGKWAWRTASIPVNAGTNTVRLALASSGQFMNLDGMMTSSDMILMDDAERVELSGGITAGGAGNTVKTDNHNGAADKSVKVKVNAPSAGDYKLGLWYRSGTDNTHADITVGQTAYKLALSNNNWFNNDWWGLAETEVHLDAGENTVTVKLDNESTYINLHAVSYGMKLEAEGTETRTNGVTKGAQWLDDFGQAGDSLSWSNSQTGDQEVPVTITYRAEEDLAYALKVHGIVHPIVFEGTSGEWKPYTLSVSLLSRENEFKLLPLMNQDHSIQVDRVKVGADEREAEHSSVQKAGSASVAADNEEIGYLGSFKQKGDFLKLTLGAVAASKSYDMKVYYRNAGEAAARSIYVNGKKAGAFTFLNTGEEWSFITVPTYLSSSQAANTVLMKMEQETEPEGIAIDRVELDGVAYEAEAAELGWEPVVAKTGGVTYTLGKTDDHGKAGQTVIFNVNMEQAAEELVFKYRSGNNPAFDILVDGEEVASDIVFGATPGGWDGGMADKAIAAPLSAGEHTIALVVASDGQYINLDSLAAGGVEYEAEAAEYAPAAHGIKTTTGTVSGFGDENDFLTFDLNLKEAKELALEISYKNAAVSKQSAVRALYINDVKQTELNFGYTGDTWSTLAVPAVNLAEGTNKIKLVLEEKDDEGIELDYLLAGDRRLDAEKADSTPALVIYKDLLLNFGHTGDEAAFPIEVEQAGETSLIFTYSNEGSTATKTLYIDDEPVLDEKGKPVQIHFTPTSNRDTFNEDVYFIVPYLSEGKHTVTLKHEATDKGTIIMRSLTLGFFNEPSVRLMDAALAAMGATHIELGTAESMEEGPNMLAHEYYPNRSKKMKASLKESMKEYYKFITAYENLLFDSKEDAGRKITITAANGSEIKTSKDGAANTLMAIARDNSGNKGFEQYDTIQLVNLLNNDENWRNAAAEPEQLKALKVTYGLGLNQSDAPNLKVYSATPDRNGGMFEELSYTWNGTDLIISIPSMTYWNMIIIDQEGNGSKEEIPSSVGGSLPSGTNERIVTEAELTAEGKQAAVTLQAGEDTILLPADAIAGLGKRTLEITKGTAKLTFPAALLAQAKEKVPGGQAKYVAISMKEAAASVKQKMTEALQKVKGLEAKAAGSVFAFEIGVIHSEGTTYLKEHFKQPVKLDIELEQGADAELAGIYYYNEGTSEWMYMGGTIAGSGRSLHAALSHFSIYAPLVWNQAYEDVNAAHWANQAIKMLTAKHIVGGKGNGRFEPSAAITRAELAALLSRAYGLSASADAGFKDVKASEWYAEAVSAVYEKGWMAGKGAGTFAPQAAITREELAVIVARIFSEEEASQQGNGSQSFTDAAQTAPWAKQAVEHVIENGFMNGIGDGRFAPKRTTSRAETALLLYRLLKV
ncbi:glycoside hydrolase family 66 protein [Paenibacillus sp. LHD-38]|uniref:glycoside hydrolase family 66 protein n=1 Tax=Paenibacillus sp. LHD-38 TaxID=3072143 RepID=UPI00280D21A9|nr:glycoside hydrolase family 66 protein [Paenibacillus sp. LHD-38]MDQ8734352.1 glycoside hydrolase family 66 protein [Paenibacillus sp. LHD-38]